MTKKYFKVEAKCGHVGRGKCIWITFVTIAENEKEAAKRARSFKRVKHNHKYIIRNLKEISFEEFVEIRSQNDIDPYLHCKNIQEQRKIEDFEERVEIDYELVKQEKKQKNTEYRRKKQVIYDKEMKKRYFEAIKWGAI